MRVSFKNSARFLRRAAFGNRSVPSADILDSWIYRRARLGGTLTVSFFRPLARRRLSTLRPPGVCMRARKPCVRFLRMLLG